MNWQPESLEPDEKERAISEHRSYALGAILSSTTFLEAMINELFAGAEDSFKEHLDCVPDEKLSLLSQAFCQGIERDEARFTILAKYEEFLDILERPTFDRGDKVYQNASNLIALRNALVHFKPEWQPAATEVPQGDQHKIHQALRSQFKVNPLTGEGNPFFPDKCLGHGGAVWALESAVAFADRFIQLAEIPCPFSHVRSRLDTTFEA